MKRLILTAAALTLAGGLTACARKPDAPVAPAAPIAAAPALSATPAPPAASSDMGKMAMPADARMAKGAGTVTAVSADSITVQHGPIAEAGWPAMTMAFKASPDLARSVKPGDKVAFDLKLQGGAGEITAIQKP
jgi:Cu(I)/Ag(I) efflux system protein CusF